MMLTESASGPTDPSSLALLGIDRVDSAASASPLSAAQWPPPPVPDYSKHKVYPMWPPEDIDDLFEREDRRILEEYTRRTWRPARFVLRDSSESEPMTLHMQHDQDRSGAVSTPTIQPVELPSSFGAPARGPFVFPSPSVGLGLDVSGAGSRRASAAGSLTGLSTGGVTGMQLDPVSPHVSRPPSPSRAGTAGAAAGTPGMSPTPPAGVMVPGGTPPQGSPLPASALAINAGNKHPALAGMSIRIPATSPKSGAAPTPITVSAINAGTGAVSGSDGAGFGITAVGAPLSPGPMSPRVRIWRHPAAPSTPTFKGLLNGPPGTLSSGVLSRAVSESTGLQGLPRLDTPQLGPSLSSGAGAAGVGTPSLLPQGSSPWLGPAVTSLAGSAAAGTPGANAGLNPLTSPRSSGLSRMVSWGGSSPRTRLRQHPPLVEYALVPLSTSLTSQVITRSLSTSSATGSMRLDGGRSLSMLAPVEASGPSGSAGGAVSTPTTLRRHLWEPASSHTQSSSFVDAVALGSDIGLTGSSSAGLGHSGGGAAAGLVTSLTSDDDSTGTSTSMSEDETSDSADSHLMFGDAAAARARTISSGGGGGGVGAAHAAGAGTGAAYDEDIVDTTGDAPQSSSAAAVSNSAPASRQRLSDKPAGGSNRPRMTSGMTRASSDSQPVVVVDVAPVTNAEPDLITTGVKVPRSRTARVPAAVGSTDGTPAPASSTADVISADPTVPESAAVALEPNTGTARSSGGKRDRRSGRAAAGVTVAESPADDPPTAVAEAPVAGTHSGASTTGTGNNGTAAVGTRRSSGDRTRRASSTETNTGATPISRAISSATATVTDMIAAGPLPSASSPPASATAASASKRSPRKPRAAADDPMDVTIAALPTLPAPADSGNSVTGRSSRSSDRLGPNTGLSRRTSETSASTSASVTTRQRGAGANGGTSAGGVLSPPSPSKIASISSAAAGVPAAPLPAAPAGSPSKPGTRNKPALQVEVPAAGAEQSKKRGRAERGSSSVQSPLPVPDSGNASSTDDLLSGAGPELTSSNSDAAVAGRATRRKLSKHA